MCLSRVYESYEVLLQETKLYLVSYTAEALPEETLDIIHTPHYSLFTTSESTPAFSTT
jgi:hypothetical protein